MVGDNLFEASNLVDLCKVCNVSVFYFNHQIDVSFILIGR